MKGLPAGRRRQREACEAYIQSQRGQGWVIQRKRYDDGGISGGTMHRPALQDLMADIGKGEVDLVATDRSSVGAGLSIVPLDFRCEESGSVTVR